MSWYGTSFGARVLDGLSEKDKVIVWEKRTNSDDFVSHLGQPIYQNLPV